MGRVIDGGEQSFLTHQFVGQWVGVFYLPPDDPGQLDELLVVSSR